MTWRQCVPVSLSLGMTALAAVMGAGCAPPEPPDTRAQDEAAIRQIEKDWSAAINTKDVNKFVANYAPDAIVMPPNEPAASTPDAIRTGISHMLALPGLDMMFQTGGIGVAKSGDMAYTYGTYSLSATGPDGKPMTDKGKYVTVWKKQSDGSWKSAVDTFNSDMPAAPPPPPAKKK